MSIEEFLAEWHNDSDRVLVHTSGSTGQPKPLWVEKRRMEASARITCQFLGLKAGDSALLCMSLDYIAGKMMVVRALTGGLQLTAVEPSGHPFSALEQPVDFVAMVPLQVYNSLQVPRERALLEQTRHLIIGGGAVDDALARELRGFPHAVWSPYGMTETLSHVALRRLSGPDASEWYTPFPSVALSLSADGCLVIDAPQVCASRLTTNDMAELRPDGRFRILGRKDNVVCSGGIKIQIEEVERLLRPHLAVPFLVTKCRDERLGEALVLLTERERIGSGGLSGHEKTGAEGLTERLRTVCTSCLPRYWQPRHYIHVDSLPLTATGKPARREAELLAVAALSGENSQ